MISISVKEATARVLATVVQAAASAGLALIGMITTGAATRQAVIGTLLGAFGVPVLTAVYRYSQAWLAGRPGEGAN